MARQRFCDKPGPWNIVGLQQGPGVLGRWADAMLPCLVPLTLSLEVTQPKMALFPEARAQVHIVLKLPSPALTARPKKEGHLDKVL